MDPDDLIKSQPENVKDLYRGVVGIASDIGSVLLAYVGALLIADVHTHLAGRPIRIRWEQGVPLYLLFAIAAPQAITIPGPPGKLAEYYFGDPMVSARHVGLIVSLVLVLAGFASLARGSFLISGHSTRYRLLVVILTLYWLMILYRTVESWPGYTKLAVTALLVFAVYVYNRDGPPPANLRPADTGSGS